VSRKVTLIVATEREDGEVRRYEARADLKSDPEHGLHVAEGGFDARDLDWLAQRIANGWLCGYDCDHCITPEEHA
jgi:hypothetical protein